MRQSLVGLRREICDRYIRSGTARFVEIDDPPREQDPADYEARCAAGIARGPLASKRRWTAEVGADGIAAILVWGDPALYDSTLRIVDEIRDRGSWH